MSVRVIVCVSVHVKGCVSVSLCVYAFLFPFAWVLVCVCLSAPKNLANHRTDTVLFYSVDSHPGKVYSNAEEDTTFLT